MIGTRSSPQRLVRIAAMASTALLLSACVVPAPPGEGETYVDGIGNVTYGDAEPVAGGPAPTPSIMPSPSRIVDPGPSRVVVRAIPDIMPAAMPADDALSPTAIAARSPSPMPMVAASVSRPSVSTPTPSVMPAAVATNVSGPPDDATLLPVPMASHDVAEPVVAIQQSVEKRTPIDLPRAPSPSIAAVSPAAHSPPPVVAARQRLPVNPGPSPVADAQALSRNQATTPINPFPGGPAEFAVPEPAQSVATAEIPSNPSGRSILTPLPAPQPAPQNSLATATPQAYQPVSQLPPQNPLATATPPPQRQPAPPPEPVSRNRPLTADSSAVAMHNAAPDIPSIAVPRGQAAPPQRNAVPLVDSSAVASRAPLIPLGRDNTDPFPSRRVTPPAVPVVEEPLPDRADQLASQDIPPVQSVTITIPIPRPKPGVIYKPDVIDKPGVTDELVAVALAGELPTQHGDDASASVLSSNTAVSAPGADTNNTDSPIPVSDPTALSQATRPVALVTAEENIPTTTSVAETPAEENIPTTTPVAETPAADEQADEIVELASSTQTPTPRPRPGLLTPLPDTSTDDEELVIASLDTDSGMGNNASDIDMPTPALLLDGSDKRETLQDADTPATSSNSRLAMAAPAMPINSSGDYDSCQIRELFEGFVSVYLNQGPRTVLMVSFRMPGAFNTTEQVLQVLGSGSFEPATYFPYAPETPDAVRDVLDSGGLQCQLTPMG